jgi:D-amino-acid dehydrogenase
VDRIREATKIYSRLFYNTGHGHLRWALAAATAQIVAGQIDTAAKS